MRKVLVIYGHDTGRIATALVVEDKLAGYPLADMHNKDANSAGLSDKARDAICELGDRLGITNTGSGKNDLADNVIRQNIVDAAMPVIANSILVCSWYA